jgi:hypothetical protein
MLNAFASLKAWEITTSVVWTIFCIGCLYAAQRAGRRKAVASYGAIWIGGVLATVVLLQAVRVSSISPLGSQPASNSAQGNDASKMPKIASARY